jgi:hypothetical protein
MTLFRATVIKPPDSTPGLLLVGGQQKSFLLPGVWHSVVAPTPNMIVEVELDQSGSVVRVTPVAWRQIVREKVYRILKWNPSG